MLNNLCEALMLFVIYAVVGGFIGYFIPPLGAFIVVGGAVLSVGIFLRDLGFFIWMYRIMCILLIVAPVIWILKAIYDAHSGGSSQIDIAELLHFIFSGSIACTAYLTIMSWVHESAGPAQDFFKPVSVLCDHLNSVGILSGLVAVFICGLVMVLLAALVRLLILTFLSKRA